jgi:transposase
MAKATTTIRQVLNYRPEHAAWFAANQTLYNQVVAFYFGVIQAHEKVLELSNKEALTALEKLTHTTQSNPSPVMPLSEIAEDVPAMFRRAAINAALGSARSFSSTLGKWRKYRGLWKERATRSIVIKVWTGTCWSWIKVHISGRELPADSEMGSPSLIRHGNQWWLHTPLERQFKSPGKIEKQVTTNPETKICSVDLNINENIAVCTVQTVEGTILATRFIWGGKEITGFRKNQLGRIARNRHQTGIIAEGEQDNGDLWNKIRHVDEHIAHLVSARIVQFAKQHGATILVFEHLGNLKPQKGKYSHRGNSKRAFWMKGRIFAYSKYKAWNEGIITSRINPRNTSRECAKCHSLIARYEAGQPAEGYTPGTPLAFCQECGMKGNADRNASLVIGQRLIARYHPSQEKPPTPLAIERREKSLGVVVTQEAECVGTQPSTGSARHGDTNEHGTAHETGRGMVAPVSDIAHQLRFQFEL